MKKKFVKNYKTEKSHNYKPAQSKMHTIPKFQKCTKESVHNYKTKDYRTKSKNYKIAELQKCNISKSQESNIIKLQYYKITKLLNTKLINHQNAKFEEKTYKTP